MSEPSVSKRTWMPLLIIGVFFFIFGFVTWLNGVLIPFLKNSCELNNYQAFMVAFAFYISYLVMAIPSSWVLRMTGFRNGMSLGLLIMALGSLLFIPAAYTREYSLFLAGLFVQGTGLSILQTASNPYVTILGPIESAAKRISIMGVCNKVAGGIGPLVIGSLILFDSKEVSLNLESLTGDARVMFLDDLAMRVVLPYLVMALVLFALAALVRFASLPEINPDENDASDTMLASRRSLWNYPYLWFGVIALFLYVGAEVIAGDTIIRYGQLIDPDPFMYNILGVTINLTNPLAFTTYTMLFMILGYFTGIALIPRVIKQASALAVFSILGVLFTIGAVLSNGLLSVAFIALLGFANSIMWPAIWPLAIGGLGRYTRTGSALLIMAIAGGAVMPLLFGLLADSYTFRDAYAIIIPSYVFIFWFATRGHKIGHHIH